MAAPRPVKFVILAVPRTGSNLLCTLLDSHPEILCHHEVYNPRGIFVALAHRDHAEIFGLGTLEERDRAPLEFLEKIWKTGASYHCVGFKWTRRQNEEVLSALVADSAVRKIVLRRRNRLKTFVSEKIAEQIDEWEVYSTAALRQPRPKIVFDAAEFEAHTETNERLYERLESLLVRHGQPFCTTHYEELFEPDEQRRLLEFLQVDDPATPLRAAAIKQNPTDLRDLIANYDDCCAYAREKGFEEELKDTGM